MTSGKHGFTIAARGDVRFCFFLGRVVFFPVFVVLQSPISAIPAFAFNLHFLFFHFAVSSVFILVCLLSPA